MNEEIEIKKVLFASMGTISVAFLLGTIAMIYTNDKNSDIFKTHLSFISSGMLDVRSDIKALESEMKISTADRYTKADNAADTARRETRINGMFGTINKRLLRLEDICLVKK